LSPNTPSYPIIIHISNTRNPLTRISQNINQGWHEKIIDLNQDFLDFLDLLVLTRYLYVRSLAVSSEEKIQKIQKIIDFYLKKS
jgi:hypothetical protein